VSERQARAAATLTRLGLDADDAAAGRIAADRLEQLVGGGDGHALLDALAEVGTAGAAEQLAALKERVGGKATRKEVRRALYRLRQRGVYTPVHRPAAPAPPRAPEIEGLLSAFDGRGHRLLWLLRPLASGGTLLVAAQVSERDGLRDLHVAEVSRKQLKAARHQLSADTGLRLIAADWRVLDALLVEAQERTPPHKDRDYLKVRARLTTDPPAPPAEPVSRHAGGAADPASLVAGSAALLEQPEIASWWPDPAAAEPFLAEVASVRESPILLSRVQQEDRLRDVLRRAAAALYPAAALARRLEGTAYVLAETNRVPAAEQALAVAAALRARPDAPGEVPLIATLMQRALGELVATAEARHREERRDSLVVTPGEALRARSSSHPPRTRG
jgi:hypothetical protein